MGDSDSSTDSLPSLFSQINKAYASLETIEEPSGSDAYQDIVERNIKACEEAISFVKKLCLFSDNEDLDELSSESIKYLLLPAFLGYFTVRKQRGDRKEILNSGKAFFENYLKLCVDYGIHKTTDDSKSLDPAKQRELKVRRMKELRSLDGRLVELQEYVEREHVDEEVKREFYITQVKKWINMSEEEISSIERELPILELMSRGGPPKQSDPRKTHPSFQPFLLTRTKAQAAVFGAGYPSLPTYSVDEFYEMQAKEGRLPQPGQMQNVNTVNERTSSDEERDEKKEEEDDPEYLKKKRDWDEFKDDNRRGDGNRKNRG